MNLTKVKTHIHDEQLSEEEIAELIVAENTPERFSLDDMQNLLRLRKSLEIEHV
jgi:hypothetical protein